MNALPCRSPLISTRYILPKTARKNVKGQQTCASTFPAVSTVFTAVTTIEISICGISSNIYILRALRACDVCSPHWKFRRCTCRQDKPSDLMLVFCRNSNHVSSIRREQRSRPLHTLLCGSSNMVTRRQRRL